MDIELKLKSLVKTEWGVEDIMNFCNVSESTAQDIKNFVLSETGCIATDVDKKRCYVSADDVIKVRGGTNRLEEIKILKSYIETIRILKSLN